MKSGVLCLLLSVSAAGAVEGRVPGEYFAVLRLIAAKQYDAAIRGCQKLIVEVPSFDGAYKKLAEASVEKGDADSAVRYFQSLLERNSANPYPYYGLGLVYRGTKDYKQAESYLLKCLELAPKFAGAVSWLVDVYDETRKLDRAKAYLEELLAADAANAAAHYGLGYFYLLRGDRGRAVASLDRAIDLNPAILHAYKLETELYFYAGELDQCLRVSSRLLDVARATGDLWYQADALSAMGAASIKTGEYSKAIGDYQQALRIQEDLGNTQGTGSSLNGLGTIHDRLGSYLKAITYYARARTVWRQRGDRRGEGTALHNIGVAYASQGKYDQALRYYRQALEVRKSLKQDTGNTLNSIGVVCAMKGEHAKAQQYYERALTIHKETEDKVGEDITLSNLGDLFARRGDYQKAVEYEQQALEIAGTIHHTEAIWKSHSRIGKALERQGKLAEALRRYEASIQAIEKMRGQLQLGEQEKAGFLDSKIGVYERIVGLFFKLGKKDAAFAYAERAKARAFLDTLAESRAQVRKEISPPQIERQTALLREISNAQAGLFRGKLAEREKARLQAALQKGESRLEEFTTELRASNPRYAELHYPEPYDLGRAQKEAIDPQTLLVEFLLGEEQSFVWLVSTQSLDMAAVPGRRAIEEKVRPYLRLIGQPPAGTESFDAYRKQAQDLFRWLLRPIQKKLDPAKQIRIVPDGILYYLPFETLVSPEYDIAYAPSATALGRLKLAKKHGTDQLDLLAFGDPLFNAGMSFDRLPFSKLEVETIANLYPVDRRRVYLQARATESAVKKEALFRYRRIHFATHGVIDENFPARSGLAFSFVKGEEDGLLRMNEILNLEMNAELVVLSACQSGLGRLMRGEGMVGLTRAFLYAGAENLVVSLWNVNDRSTARFMQSFYESMRSGKSAPAALRGAKQAMLRSEVPAYRFPYFWAPFILVGH